MLSVNVIFTFVKWIVTGLAPTPVTLSTLLNQMKFPAEIDAPLKFDAIELGMSEGVHGQLGAVVEVVEVVVAVVVVLVVAGPVVVVVLNVVVVGPVVVVASVVVVTTTMVVVVVGTVVVVA